MNTAAFPRAAGRPALIDPNDPLTTAWVKTWVKAGRALEAIHRREVRDFVYEEHLQEIEEQMMERSSAFRFGPGVWLNTSSAEDLMILKAFAGRPKDWAAVEGVLSRQLEQLGWAYIEEHLRPLCELKGEPEAVERLAACVGNRWMRDESPSGMNDFDCRVPAARVGASCSRVGWSKSAASHRKKRRAISS